MSKTMLELDENQKEDLSLEQDLLTTVSVEPKKKETFHFLVLL